MIIKPLDISLEVDINVTLIFFISIYNHSGIDIPGEVDVRGAPKNKYAVRPTISDTPRPSLLREE